MIFNSSKFHSTRLKCFLPNLEQANSGVKPKRSLCYGQITTISRVIAPVENGKRHRYMTNHRPGPTPSIKLDLKEYS